MITSSHSAHTPVFASPYATPRLSHSRALAFAKKRSLERSHDRRERRRTVRQSGPDSTSTGHWSHAHPSDLPRLSPEGVSQGEPPFDLARERNHLSAVPAVAVKCSASSIEVIQDILRPRVVLDLPPIAPLA